MFSQQAAPVSGLLKTAMDTSGLTFTAAPAGHGSPASPREQPLPGRSAGGDSHDPAPGTAGGGSGVGRAASMRDGAQGAGPGLEADLAHLGNKAGDAAPKLPVGGKGAALENAKNDRRPFSGTGGPAGRSPPPAGGGVGGGGGVSASRAGEAGTIPGSNRGAIPGRTRGETSPELPATGDPRDMKGSDRAGRREAVGVDAPANPDAGRRRGWGRPVGRGGGQTGGGNGGAQPSQNVGGGGGGSDIAAAGRGGSSSNGGGTAAIDSKASAEDILASMGLKSGLSLGPDGVTGGVPAGAAKAPVGARTPAEMMAASSGGGAGGGGSVEDTGEGGKQGLFGRLWNGKKGKRKER